MKVYQFNTDNGIYAGELFEDECQLAYVDGVTQVPPPHYGNGHVPVFDLNSGTWSLMTRDAALFQPSEREQRLRTNT